MALNNMRTTLGQTAFYYNRCMDVYSSPTTYVYHMLRIHLERSRRALYTRSTILEMCMALHSSIGTTLVQTEISYTRCMDVYAYPTAAPLKL